MSMLKKLVAREDRQKLSEQGVYIKKIEFTDIMKEFYHTLNDAYTLRGSISKQGAYSVSFGDYGKGSYYPAIAPDYSFICEGLRIDMQNVDSIKFYFSTCEWIDIHLTLQDNTLVAMCFAPANWGIINDYFDLAVEQHA